jgi:hypothetical protein
MRGKGQKMSNSVIITLIICVTLVFMTYISKGKDDK